MTLRCASREVRLQWFARAVLDAAWSGTDVEGGDIQAWATAAGLVDVHTVTEADLAEGSDALACVENAECLEVGDTWCSFSADLMADNVKWSELSAKED